MEEVELVEKMLSGIGKPKNSSSKNAKDLLDGMSESKMLSLKEAVSEIAEQIKMREALHKEIMADIESLKSNINNMTPALTADNAKVIMEFQKKLIEAEEIKVQEKLNCFRDISLLKKELREWIRELRDKEKSASFLGDLLNE